MAGDAKSLEVVLIIRTTSGTVDDVIRLKLQRDDATGLACVLIAQEDCGAFTAPRSTATTRAPTISSLRCDWRSEWPTFRLLHTGRKGSQSRHTQLRSRLVGLLALTPLDLRVDLVGTGIQQLDRLVLQLPHVAIETQVGIVLIHSLARD